METIFSEPIPLLTPPKPPRLPGWRLLPIGDEGKEAGVIFRLLRAPEWRRQQLWRALRNLLAAFFFFALTLASLRGGLATPNPGALLPDPAILPTLGWLVGALFILQSAWVYQGMRRAPLEVRVLVGEATRLQLRRGGRVLWEKENADLQAVVVSERLASRRKAHEIRWAALSLWLSDGSLREILILEKQSWPTAGISDLQRTGQLLAGALALPCRYQSWPAKPEQPPRQEHSAVVAAAMKSGEGL